MIEVTEKILDVAKDAYSDAMLKAINAGKISNVNGAIRAALEAVFKHIEKEPSIVRWAREPDNVQPEPDSEEWMDWASNVVILDNDMVEYSLYQNRLQYRIIKEDTPDKEKVPTFEKYVGAQFIYKNDVAIHNVIVTLSEYLDKYMMRKE